MLVGTNNAFYGCGKRWHIVRDCPQVRNQARTDAQPRPNSTALADPLKRNIFYSLNGREEKEKSGDEVSGTLYVF